MANKTGLTYNDCTIGANEPLDKYTINRVFRRCYSVAKDRAERLVEIAETKPYIASETAPGAVRFVKEYESANQRAVSDAHVMNLSSFIQYADEVVKVSDKCMESAVGGITVYTQMNESSVNILPNGLKLMTGSFVVGYNDVDLTRLQDENIHDMDSDEKKDAFYSTTFLGRGELSGMTGKKVVYVPYMDRARIDEYDADQHRKMSARGELSSNLFEKHMRAFRVASDIGAERNKYIVEAMFNFSFSIQDFITFCDMKDVGVESEVGTTKKRKHGEAELNMATKQTYRDKFYFYRKPVIVVQAIDVSPDYNQFNKTERNGELTDMERPINSGVDASTYVPPRNTAFVENFSCDYDVGDYDAGTEGLLESGDYVSDMIGEVVNNNLTIGLSSRFVIGDDRDNVGYASAKKLNHKIKVTFMLMGV